MVYKWEVNLGMRGCFAPSLPSPFHVGGPCSGKMPIPTAKARQAPFPILALAAQEQQAELGCPAFELGLTCQL